MVLGQEKVSLLNLPTPLEFLKNISEELGIQLYLKRDDMTGLGMGGNKLRKLEYILKEAQDKGATMLITEGGVQTNHGRLTAAVAAKYNMRCAIVAIGDYPGELSANLLLDRLMGAEVIIKKDDGRPSLEQYKELVRDTIKKYEAQGETVYYIPLGGSDDIGILGYYECAVELTKQAAAMGISDARVISAAGSLGTYMGLYCGFHNEDSGLALTGVAISPFDDFKEQSIVELFDSTKEKYGMKISAGLKDFDIEKEYVRGGYNLPSKEVRDAVRLMAGKEAILLDPCYTGKCFAAIIDMVKDGKIKKGEKIIMIHTGGAPGLYTKHHRVEFEKELIDGVTILK